MKNVLCMTLCLSIFCSSLLVTGCAGRTANPAAAYMPGDDKRSCEALKAEYTDNESQIKKLQTEKNNTGLWNIGCFVTGFFLIVPWFLMDVKDAPKIEMEALKKRNSNIKIMASERDCDFLGTAAAGK